MLGYKIYMAVASIEPLANFLENAELQYKNIDNFLKDPIKNELETARLRSEKRTHFDIQPLTEDELKGFF